MTVMDLRRLKKIRQWVSGILLVLLILVFVDVYNLMPSRLIRALVYLQVIPSLMKTLAGGGGGFIEGFVCVLIFTLLFGRVYCSFLCPLGTAMDVLSRAGGNKKRFLFTRPFNGLRYGVLAVTVLVFVSGSLALVDVLDPYSVFGRTLATLGRPAVVLVNNGLSFLFETMGFYSLAPVPLLLFQVSVAVVVAVHFSVVTWFSIKRGRLYCNTFCPVGACLGLASRFQVFRLVISGKTCTGCGLCERNCKAECIDVKARKIDTSRCVGCFTCLSLCPAGSVTFSGKRRSGEPEKLETDHARRNLIRMMVFLMAGFPKILEAQVKRPLVFVKNRIPVKRKHPVTPPGSLSIGHFTGACTACYLCVTRCPGKVLEPGFDVYGKAGVLMPWLSNRKGYCNFECTVCGEVCPTGAIFPLSREAKKQVQVGQVRFIRENCIVITQKTECGACSEHCPTKAVNMVVENGLRVPVVNPDICVGCGACEYACPSLPHKSIYVEGNAVHRKAMKPVTKTIEKPRPNEDFPF